MNDKELSALKALAEAATPGPWFVQQGDDYNFMNMTAISTEDRGTGHLGQLTDDNLLAVTFHQSQPWVACELDDLGNANSAYIAAANPAAILSLISRLEQAEAVATSTKPAETIGQPIGQLSPAIGQAGLAGNGVAGAGEVKRTGDHDGGAREWMAEHGYGNQTYGYALADLQARIEAKDRERAQFARQQAPVGGSVDTPEFRALELAYAKAFYAWEDNPSAETGKLLGMARQSLIAHITAWKDAQLARERQGRCGPVSKAELWDAIHQYVSDYGDQFRSPPTTGAGKRCDASRDELDATIDRLYTASAAQAQGEPVAWIVGLDVFKFKADAERNVRNPDLKPLPLYLGPAPQADEVRDAKDAARYRYIRDTGTLDAAIWDALEGHGSVTQGGELDQAAYAAGMDRAIDAALRTTAADNQKGGEA